jgi:hypothetical protein
MRHRKLGSLRSPIRVPDRARARSLSLSFSLSITYQHLTFPFPGSFGQTRFDKRRGRVRVRVN